VERQSEVNRPPKKHTHIIVVVVVVVAAAECAVNLISIFNLSNKAEREGGGAEKTTRHPERRRGRECFLIAQFEPGLST
jgi:hypothetical protein